MGEPTKTKTPSKGCSFRSLCRRRRGGSGSKNKLGGSGNLSSSTSSMGQSKSLCTSTSSGPTTVKTINISTANRNKLDGGTTSIVSLTQKDKTLKSRSISSLSKVLRNRKWRPKRRNSISASFNMNDRDIKVEFVNVNQATEEELMTLPGISRALARNIVNHRILIGGYRKVEDLALVSGMGATKLDLIRNEICTSKRRNLSRASSKSQSVESLPSSAGSTRPGAPYKSPKLVNINTATIFDLMTVQGINQALAARIINYRDKKGPFKYVDDLRHVGLSYRHLGALRTFLTVSSSADLSHVPTDSKSNASHLSGPLTPPIRPIVNGELTSHRRSSSVPPLIIKDEGRAFPLGQELDLGNLERVRIPPPSSPKNHSALEDMTEIFELMSLKSSRPIQDCQIDQQSVKSDSRLSSYRIASWNLENLTEEKVANPGVLEVITRTILENRLSLIAVQEICDKLALQKICDELNEPRLSRNRAWPKPRGTWTFILDETVLHFNKTSHRLGVLYNSDQIDNVTIPKASEIFSPIQNGSLWQFSVFKVTVRKALWILINVLSTPLSQYTNGHAVDRHQETVGELIQMLAKDCGADGGVLLGSFNSQNIEKGLGNLGDLENISLQVEDEDGRNVPVGSVWITPSMKQTFTGERGRITDGLSHLAIPNGWSWGGRATAADPFWCSFYQETSKTEISKNDATPKN